MMKVSLPGLFHNTEAALRSSTDDYACVSAYSLGELVDNLRLLANGECTKEEFFECYVFDANAKGKYAESVRKERYRCMREDEDEEEEVE